MDRDRHVRRSADDYAIALSGLLPTGLAWPREATSVQSRVVKGLAKIFGYVDGRAADLLERESDPRQTVEMLDSWERAWGLPDPCLAVPQSIAERQRLLVAKMTMLGGQSRQFFINYSADIGYTITIQEFAPFMVGVSRVGNTTYENTLTGGDNQHMRWQLGAPEMRFYWTIQIGGVSLTWFRVTKGETGVDPHLRIGIPEDLECIIHRYQPAHTQVIFDFTGIGGISNPMQGTP